MPAFPRSAACAHLGSLLLGSVLAAQVAVSPADRTACEGSSFTHFPLGRPNARFQFLYGDLPPSMVIHGHSYRRDAAGVRGRVEAFSADLSVQVSVAPHAPSQAAQSFQANTTAIGAAVLPRQIVAFAATDRPTLDPAPVFELPVPYATPFVLPASPSTLCVDITLFGNRSAAGVDRNLSVYLDSHDWVNGRNEQPAFRIGGGCVAPGHVQPMYATLSLWHLGNSMQLDIAAREAIGDDGSGLTRTFVCLGTQAANVPVPGTLGCSLLTSTDVWYLLPASNSPTGSFDGTLTGLPVLPPGYRLWLQTGSVHLGTAALAFGDLSTLVTPTPAPPSAPAARIAASTDRTATSGVVAFSVPVTQFF